MLRRLQLLVIGAVLLVAAFSTGLSFLFYLVYLAILVVGGSYVLTRLGLSDLEAGYAVSPLTQVIEVPSTRIALQTELSLVMHPHVLLRVGRAGVTPGTPRRLLTDVLDDRFNQ